MLIVFLIVVVDLLGFGIVLPLLPVTGKEYLEPLFPGDDKGVKAMRGLMIGLLMAVFSFMQFIFSPMWGRLSDRIGRRPVLLVGLVGSVVFYALFGYAAGLPIAGSGEIALVLMLIARAGAGIAGATIATAQAVIADSTPPEKRKHGMALIGAAFGIAFTVGPILGALAMMATDNARTATSLTGYVAAALSAVALLLAVLLLPETRQLPTATPAARRLFDLAAWRSVLTNPSLAPVVLTFFLATIGFGVFESTLSLLIQYVFDIKLDDTKGRLFWLFAYVGFVLLVAQGFLYRRLAKRLSEVTFMAIGIVLMSVGVLGLGGVGLLKSMADSGHATLLAMMMIALAVAVVGFAFLTPSAQALISRRTSPDRQGEVLGVNQSASALARIIGPVLGNGLFALTETHMLPYLFGAGLLLLMLPLLPRIRRG